MRRLLTRLAYALAVAVVLSALTGCGGDASTPETGGNAPETPAAGNDAPPTQDTPAEEVPVELPPAPADVSGMKDWLSEAYPDAGWLARIQKIEYVPGEVPDSGGFANAVVVTTDLDFASEQASGQEIVAAIGESHLGWAKQYVVRFADGNNILAGGIFDPTP